VVEIDQDASWTTGWPGELLPNWSGGRQTGDHFRDGTLRERESA